MNSKCFRVIFRIFVPLVLSSSLMLLGCGSHENISLDTTLIIPSATADPISSALYYQGSFIPALEGEGPNEIWLNNYESRPNVLVVAMGTAVTWTNNDYWKPLTVVSDDGLFARNIEPSGGTFSYIFEYAGTFGYSIDPYSGVWQGLVVVVK